MSYGATNNGVVNVVNANDGGAAAAAAASTAAVKMPTTNTSCVSKLIAFYREQDFLILVVVAVLLAWVNPSVGIKYMHPAITATWLAVIFIFLCTGLSLKTEEFQKAFFHMKFNVFVQTFNFFVVSSLVYGISRGLASIHLLSQDLADGMVVCASLPMAINMVVVLTKAGNGDEASAVFNATAANLVGVFLSPLLIPFYLGVTGDVDLITVFYKLTLKVVLPVFVGQVLQHIPSVNDYVKRHKTYFKLAPQYCLIFIIYTVFCQTFMDGSDSSVRDIFLMIFFQFLLLSTVSTFAWILLKALFPNEPKLRVTGLFACTHKTVSIGVPLIGAIYEGNPAVGMYTLPLLIWHPMQLVLGSTLAPHLAAFVKREEERLGIVEEEDTVQETPVAMEQRRLLGQQKV